MRLPGYHGGSGPPLLLIHGLGARWEVWEPILPFLEAHHEVDAPDLPGFGVAPALDGPHSPHALAEALEEHLNLLGWAEPHLAGNSLGGLVAFELARRGRANTITALSPAGLHQGWEDAWARGVLWGERWMAKALRPLVPVAMTSAALRTLFMSVAMARPWQVGPEWATLIVQGFADAPAVEDALRGVRFEQTTAHLDQVLVPVTVAWGTRDRLLPRGQGLRFARALPKARLVRLDGLGHQPMSDDPELVAEVILRTTGAHRRALEDGGSGAPTPTATPPASAPRHRDG